MITRLMLFARSTKQSLYLLLGLSLLVASGAANATVLSFQEGDGGAFSETDASRFGSTRVLSSETQLLGHTGTLNTDTTTVGRPDQYFTIGYFDLIGSAAGQVAAGSAIDNASLRFFQTNNTSNGLQAVFLLLNAWDEDTVTNQNFFTGSSALPGNPREPQAGVDYDPTAITTFRPNTPGPFDVDVTAAVQAWSNGVANFGLLFMNIDTVPSRATDGWVVNSDDATTQSLRPLLTVTTAVPEPGTLALFGSLIFALGLGRRRRR